MGNIFSIFNSIYNDTCIFCRNKKKNTHNSTPVTMCVITPLSHDYDIQITNSTVNSTANSTANSTTNSTANSTTNSTANSTINSINTTSLITEKQNIKV